MVVVEVLLLLLEKEEDHHLQNQIKHLVNLIKVHQLKVQLKLKNQKKLKCPQDSSVTFVDENMEQHPLIFM